MSYMRCSVKGVLKALFVSSALSGCGANLSDFVHAREGDTPEIRTKWAMDSSRQSFFETKVHSINEIYIGWHYSFQPENP